MSILNQIRDTLETLDEHVYYGGVDNNTEVDKLPLQIWNYTVFARQTTRRNQGRTGYTDTFSVVVVREEYIPDDYVRSVINAMETIPGMRLADADIEYTYTRRPNTGVIIEMALMTFSLPGKRCGA